jgi:cell division protease FtsH
VRRIVEQAHAEARRLIEAHRDVLEQVTRRLLECEVMDGDELRRFFPALAEPVPPVPASPEPAPPVPAPLENSEAQPR